MAKGILSNRNALKNSTTTPWTTTSIKTASYSANFWDSVRVNPTGGQFVVTLPSATSMPGGQVKVTNVSASYVGVIVATVGGQLIDGVLAFSFDEARDSVSFESDGTNWIALDAHPIVYTADGTFASNLLVIASPTTDLRAVAALTSSANHDIIGISSTAAAGAGSLFWMDVDQGHVRQVKSDGTAITRGEYVGPSNTSAGRIKPGASNSMIGVALASAAAVADTLVPILFTGAEQ